jgi:DHA1 family bicyclomycin/chloramphenicol resistance-like MFS transporter
MPRDHDRTLRPGSAGFTLVLSMAMAGTALAIDTVLPAFPEIRDATGLPSDSTQVAALVTTFLLGQGLGLVPAGVLADRFGRRPILWGGLAIYLVGAIGAALAPTLEIMLVARLVWGFGAAGPRVAATAMIRDAFEGEAMAKQMSTIMAVFLIVPTIAPSLGAGLIAVGPWQLVYWVCAAFTGVVMIMSLRLPATMPESARRELNVREIASGFKIVFVTPGTMGYMLAMVGLFAAFISYLASSEIIIDEVFGLAGWFPVIFGALAIVMAFAMIVNGRIVESVGLDRMIRIMLGALLVADAVLVALAFATGGEPPFAIFLLSIGAVIACQQLLVPNINAAAMRPLAAVAGSAAAMLGMVPMILGSLLGSFIDQAYDGTITPLAIGFALAGFLTAIGLWWARNATREPTEPVTPEPAPPWETVEPGY